MSFLIAALLVVLALSLVNAVASWFGGDISAEPEPDLDEAHPSHAHGASVTKTAPASSHH